MLQAVFATMRSYQHSLYFPICQAISFHTIEKIDLTVDVAGTAPFVVDTTNQTGISIELWQNIASRLGWRYQARHF